MHSKLGSSLARALSVSEENLKLPRQRFEKLVSVTLQIETRQWQGGGVAVSGILDNLTIFLEVAD